jgi:DNA-nicking Smr family endonuclease
MTAGRRRGGALPPDEAALWAKVLAEVAPLPGRVRATPPPQEAEPAAPPSRPASAPAPQSSRSRPPPDLAAIEARLARRLARGAAAIDARLDLHGLRQEAAHRRLTAFLAAAQHRGARLVLVITGKGGPAADPARAMAGDERGVLRRQVPLWLADPALRPLVLGFSQAHPSHGGAGALYVRLRRLRRP